jgi:hypothetical protein
LTKNFLSTCFRNCHRQHCCCLWWFFMHCWYFRIFPPNSHSECERTLWYFNKFDIQKLEWHFWRPPRPKNYLTFRSVSVGVEQRWHQNCISLEKIVICMVCWIVQTY